MADLSQARACELFVYANGALLRKVDRGGGRKAGQTVGARRASGYVATTCEGRTYLVHRIVWAMHHGAVPAILDHINGDPSDNRIENLRAASSADNAANSRGRNSSGGHKGVTYRHRTGKYQAEIVREGRRHDLGRHATASEAAQAYDDAAKRLCGEFARTEATWLR